MSDLTGQFLGQYEILAPVSRGSTSTIYKAYQPKLDRFVAIKVLSPQVVDEEGFLARFTQEARAVAQLDHPNIVPVYDFDQTSAAAYIVFKYVESGTLRAMMTGEPLDLCLTVDVVTQVGLALGYAHRRGVIHRDVKPSNILIGQGRWAMLTDFGLAKILSGGRQLTKSGVGMGTPDYMSPEQAQGRPSDGRSDLYSLGATLYEMAAGRVPFEADSSMGVVVKHITQPPTPPRELNANLPAAVEKVILTAMAKDPGQRFQTAEAMVAALVRAANPALEQPAIARPELTALSLNRPIEAHASQPTRWKRIRDAGGAARTRLEAAGEPFKRRVWNQLSLRQRMFIRYGAVAAIVAWLIIGSIVSPGPAHVAPVTPTVMSAAPAAVSLVSAAPTAMATATATAAATATPIPITPIPITPIPITPVPATPTPPAQTPAPRNSPTPEWVYLSSSATIRPGIYVKIVRPAGLDVSKEAGFDKDFLTTLPAGRIVYVAAGPVRANTLNWIKVTDGATTGWSVQDYVVAYGIKNTP